MSTSPGTNDQAATLAIAALGFLAEQPERLGDFMATGGLDGATLRARIDDPDLWRAAMDFLMADDRLVQDFCRERGVTSRALHGALHALNRGFSDR